MTTRSRLDARFRIQYTYTAYIHYWGPRCPPGNIHHLLNCKPTSFPPPNSPGADSTKRHMHPTLASSPHLATPQSNQGTSRATGGQLRPTAIEPLPSVCCRRNYDQPGMDACLSRLSVGVGTRCSSLWPPARNQVPHPYFVVAQFPPRSWRAKRSPLWISMRGCRLRLAHGCGPPRTTHHAACAAANASTSSYNGAPRTPASNYHSRSARHAPPCPQTVHDARIHAHTRHGRAS